MQFSDRVPEQFTLKVNIVEATTVTVNENVCKHLTGETDQAEGLSLQNLQQTSQTKP